MAEPPPLVPAILERLPVGVFVVDASWTILVWNRTLAEWTGLAAKEALGRDARQVLPKLAEPRNYSRLEPLLEGGPPVVFSYQLHADLLPDAHGRGPRRARYCTASSLPGGGLLFAVEDRTEVAALVRNARAEVERRRAAEEGLRSALEAKEMLVREASHRVKNNLAMIVSLINLEEDKAGSEAARGFMADLESRIRSIAVIHELLYKGDLGAEVELGEYLSTLGHTMVDTLTAEGGRVRLEFALEGARLDLDATLYVGMMVAELLTNSLKYAREPDRDLVITVGLRHDPAEGVLEVLVTDDGPGFPGDQLPSGASLGWNLVHLLSAELGGAALILPGPGARVAIRIPEGRREAAIVPVYS
jgi:two-component sensor histidine kinase